MDLYFLSQEVEIRDETRDDILDDNNNDEVIEDLASTSQESQL